MSVFFFNRLTVADASKDESPGTIPQFRVKLIIGSVIGGSMFIVFAVIVIFIIKQGR
jgi:hypothetical protein